MDLQVLYSEIEEVKRIVQSVELQQQTDHLLLIEHDKILVRGNGHPSLQENMRVMNKSLSDFIDEVREERARRNKLEEEEKKRKLSELNRWKWTIIGLGITLIASVLVK